MTVQQRVKQFITESFYVSDPSDLADDVSLIDSGIVDSTGMMDIILFLEGEYDIQIGDQETVPENLESVSKIAAFVARKQAPSVEASDHGST